MRIDTIYVAGWRGDLQYARCCVASIRYWHPAVDVCLIKDEIGGAYDTTELERAFNVRVLDGTRRVFGWGVAKLEPLFQRDRRRVLILDCDVILVGPILDLLEATDEDFVVVEENHPIEAIRRDYFDPDQIARQVPGYRFPGWVFNTGQLVATTGLLTPEDFGQFLSLTRPLVVSRGGVSDHGRITLPITVPMARERQSGIAPSEQGPLNIVLHTKMAQGALTLRRMRFMRWPPRMANEDVAIDRIVSREGYPFVLHWAGPKPAAIADAPLAHVLQFFSAQYDARVASSASP